MDICENFPLNIKIDDAGMSNEKIILSFIEY